MHPFRDDTAHDGTRPAAAMTTPFHFPCGVKFYESSGKNDLSFNPACAPPNFIDYWSSSVRYYSPALCPLGYTIGCERWHFEQGPTVEPTETAMMCVPHGYACGHNPSYVTSATERAVMIQIRWASTDLPTLATPPMTRAPPVTIPHVNLPERKAAWVPEKVLNERQDEESMIGATNSLPTAVLPPPDPTSVLSSPTPTSPTTPLGFPSRPPEPTTSVDTKSTSGGTLLSNTTSTSPATTSTGPPSGNNSSGSGPTGQTPGQQAGLGVGLGLGLPLLLGLAAFLVWKRRRGRGPAGGGAQSSQVEQYTGMPELEGWPDGTMIDVGSGTPATEREKAIFASVGYGQQQPSAELDTVRAESYPAELSSQERAHGVESESAPRPVSGRQWSSGQPYMQKPFDPQQLAQEYHNYSPQATEPPQSGHAVPSSALDAATTGRVVLAPESSSADQPTQLSPLAASSASQAYSTPQSGVISPASHNPTSTMAPGSGSAPSPSHTTTTTTTTTTTAAASPDNQDLEQLRQKHAELEMRRQRLLQLQDIEQEQAALRARIAAAEGGVRAPPGSSGTPTSGKGS